METVILGQLDVLPYRAFANCPELKDVYCISNTAPRPYDTPDNFEGSTIEYANLYVPVSALASFKSSEVWSAFGNIVGLTGDEDLPFLEKFSVVATDEQGNQLAQLAQGIRIPETEATASYHKYIQADGKWYESQNGSSYYVEIEGGKSQAEVVFVPSEILGYEDVNDMELSQQAVNEQSSTGYSNGNAFSLAAGASAKGKLLIPAGHYTFNLSCLWKLGTNFSISFVNASGVAIGEEFKLTSNSRSCQIALQEDAYLVLTNSLHSTSVTIDYYTLTKPLCQISLQAIGSGTISVNGELLTNGSTVDCEYGEDVTLTFNPAEGYKVVSASLSDGTDITEEAQQGSYTISKHAGILTVMVEFALDKLIFADEFMTVCSTGNLSFPADGDVKAWVVVGVTESTAKLVRVDVVPAYTGALLQAQAGDTLSLSYTDESVYQLNMLVGTTSATTVWKNAYNRYNDYCRNYVFKTSAEGTGFYPVEESYELPGGSAYLPIPTQYANTANARVLKLEFDTEGGAVIDPEANGIDEHVQQADDAKTVYSVSGRQLPAMQRGMNIIRMSDGTVRKIMVK